MMFFVMMSAEFITKTSLTIVAYNVFGMRSELLVVSVEVHQLVMATSTENMAPTFRRYDGFSSYRLNP